MIDLGTQPLVLSELQFVTLADDIHKRNYISHNMWYGRTNNFYPNNPKPLAG
jgi:hypothetical protein